MPIISGIMSVMGSSGESEVQEVLSVTHDETTGPPGENLETQLII